MSTESADEIVCVELSVEGDLDAEDIIHAVKTGAVAKLHNSGVAVRDIRAWGDGE